MTSKDGRLVDMRAMYSMVPTEQLKKWYLVSDKVKEVVQQKKEQKNQDPILKTWHKAALFALVGYVTYLFYPFGAKSEESTNTTPSSPSNSSPQAQQQLPKILEGVYITCSVISNKQNSTYCFEKEGNPFYPNSIDAVVNVVSACTAKLKYMDNEYTVHCLPYRVDSFSAAKPINSQPIEQDLIAAN